MTPRLVLTPGEPAGIGPDLTVMLAQRARPEIIVALADPQLLEQRAHQLRLDLKLLEWRNSANTPPIPAPAGSLYIQPVPLRELASCGVLNPANGGYVLETLRAATLGCLTHEFDALVTGPVHKGLINEAGFAFSGHTEYLAAICEKQIGEHVQPVMLLATEGLRVALATTHLPLSEVSRAITQEGLTRVLRILHRDLQRRFGLPRPRILVCGLNPHAGEGGHLGREEIEIIIPALDSLRQEGLHIIGPLPADTLFTPPNLAQADAVLAMYHDQGLPVLKHLGFGCAVNITLGLPIIRTSVDHGTALELAGTGKVNLGSLEAAIQLAGEMATKCTRSTTDN